MGLNYDTNGYDYANRNARLRAAELKTDTGFRTCTRGRDEGSTNVSVVTRTKGGTTLKVYDGDISGCLEFDGATARTIYETLAKHFEER